VHAPTEDKDDNIKDSFYKELEQVFNQLTYETFARSKKGGRTFLS
jgi:hypothetical protein